MALPIRIHTTAMPSVVATVSGASHLLALPGEIRNRIYEFAIADVLSQSELPGLAHPNRKAQTVRESQFLTRSWRLFRRTCLGLTQTCRQLRNEILPMYRARVPISVRITEVEEYLILFVLPQSIGNIVIEIYDTAERVDLRDVILFGVVMPSLRLSYRHNRLPMHKLLVETHQYPTFYDFLAQCVDRLIVVPTSVEHPTRSGASVKRFLIGRLEVYVKKSFAQRWMEVPVEGLDVNYLAKWRWYLGLPDGVDVVPRASDCDQSTWDWVTGTEIVRSETQ